MSPIFEQILHKLEIIRMEYTSSKAQKIQDEPSSAVTYLPNSQVQDY